MALPWAKWLLAGKQVILKSDFLALWYAISGQGAVRMQPPLSWVSVTTVKVAATADCPAAMQFNGMPNILNPSVQVSGGLSDGIVRSVVADTSMIFGSGGLYGITQTEKELQWYAIFATADNADTDFVLKAMPFMRVKSQASQVISLGTLTTPATGIGYGFTADELIGAMVYVLSGDSKGLMRPVIHNNNDNTTGGTIEYSGTALTLAAGDWFIVLPATNFRYLGLIFNKSNGDIRKFNQDGSMITWLETVSSAAPTTPFTENIGCASPLAIAMGINGYVATFIGHPDNASSPDETSFAAAGVASETYTFAETAIKNCRYKGSGTNPIYVLYYKYPPGCGY